MPQYPPLLVCNICFNRRVAIRWRDKSTLVSESRKLSISDIRRNSDWIRNLGGGEKLSKTNLSKKIEQVNLYIKHIRLCGGYKT